MDAPAAAICAEAVVALERVTGASITCELGSGFYNDRIYERLRVEDKVALPARVAAVVNTGIGYTTRGSPAKDSLIGYLSVSSRACSAFAAAVRRIVVELTTPAKALTAAENGMRFSLNSDDGTLTCVIKMSCLFDNTAFDAWGPRLDSLLGLCALTDGYKDKAQALLAALAGEVSAALGVALDVDVDWSFVDDAIYKQKTSEATRQAWFLALPLMLRFALLDRPSGLVRHLSRSARATQTFLHHVRAVRVWLSLDNRCKTPLDFADGGDGVLLVGVRANVIDTPTVRFGWGPLLDDRFALQVVDEEGSRAIAAACQALGAALPEGTVVDFDWKSVLDNERWKRVKVDERQAIYTSLARKGIPAGITDRTRGLAAYLARSERARQWFASRVGTVRVRLETTSNTPKPVLLEGGILVLPILFSAADQAPEWGEMAATALALRMEEEDALRKAEAALAKSTAGHAVAVVVDWASVLDEAKLAREEHRLARIAAFVPWLVTGLGGRSGLLNAGGAELRAVVDTIVVRMLPVLRGRAPVEMRYGGPDRVMEIVCKTAAVTGSGGDPESWHALFSITKPDETFACVPVVRHALLSSVDGPIVCAVAASAPVPNALMDGFDAPVAVVSAVSPALAAAATRSTPTGSPAVARTVSVPAGVASPALRSTPVGSPAVVRPAAAAAAPALRASSPAATSPAAVARPASVADWSMADVQSWLVADVQLPHVCGLFAKNRVDGAVLIELSDAELKSEIGIEALGDRKKILKTLQLLNGSLSASAPALPKSASSGGMTTATNRDEFIPASSLQFVKTLGSGAFGQVWLALWHQKTHVAVKVLTGGTEASEREFIQEIAILQRVRHPNVVICYGCAHDEARGLMLICEFMEDGSLLDFLQKRSFALTEEMLSRICLDVCGAMDHLQRVGIVHRDLATRNVLIRRGHDDQVLVKLSDFGLGQQLDSGYFVAEKASLVPLKWTAPEAIFFKKWTTASDVWSYGVVVWEVFSGGMEPYADWTGKLSTRIRDGERLSRPARCPPDLWKEIVLPCFEMDPKKRPTFDVLYRKLQMQIEASLARNTAEQSSATYVDDDDDAGSNSDLNMSRASLYDSNSDVRVDNSFADLESSAYSVHTDN